MDLEKAINQRHSVRRFTSKKPNWEEIIEAIDAANKAPLAGNIPTNRFILVKDKQKIEKIANACQQEFVSDVDYIVVLCSFPDQCVRSYGERASRYMHQQAGAAIQNFLLKLTDLNLATCWVGSYADQMIKDCLDIPENCEVEAIFPIGFELGKGKQAKKPDLDFVLWFDKWKNKYMEPWKTPEGL